MSVQQGNSHGVPSNFIRGAPLPTTTTVVNNDEVIVGDNRPIGKRTHPMPSKLAKNAEATRTAEAAARAANAVKLANVVRKQAPVKELEKGSGALVGVAAGATDHQPHTKRAVEQARAKARGVTAPVTAKAAPVKVKAPVKAPKAEVDQKYKAGPKPYAGKPGSWTYYMITHVLKYKSTAKARAAQSEFTNKKLDFKWMAEIMHYITFE